LNFDKGGSDKDVFEHQNKMKLVTPCKMDEYVLRDYTIYKIYNLIATNSFNARLALVDFVDELDKKKDIHKTSFLIEDEDLLANRLGLDSVENRPYQQYHLDQLQMASVAIFEYMIGNTDWSVR
jgi:hypothetical protein